MPSPKPAPKPDLKKLRALYAHLGGEDAVRAILRDFYGRMSRDLLVGFFFEGKDVEHIADQQLKFLLRAMGARKTYAGKAPATAHLALPPILKGHFDRRLRLLEDTLRDHGLSEKDIRTWIEFESAFRASIQHG
jgi:truncated hemoglobin YjbI